uniref:Uncharacterized protein n=1 Tax=Daphnia galeata TaxID=27404 RepID=A0A8J2S045_9CRUS|nr:unnamed protein product [Daphnia galeata]
MLNILSRKYLEFQATNSVTTVTAANTLQQNIARAIANNIKDEIRSINRTPFCYFYIITVSEQLTTMQWILVFSAIGLASAGVLPHPPELLRTLHTLMSVDELSRTFGVDNPSQVDAYEVVYIRRHRIFVPEDSLQRDASPKTKRSDPDEN